MVRFDWFLDKKTNQVVVGSIRVFSSSETQRQIVGTRESLNGHKNMAPRKVKDGEKSP